HARLGGGTPGPAGAPGAAPLAVGGGYRPARLRRAASRAEGAAGGRPGCPAGRGPRDLPVRDLVEHHGGARGGVRPSPPRAGNGPLPTGADPEQAEKLRSLGAEYGATTGRPRRCGWF